MAERKKGKILIWVFRKPLKGRLEVLIFQQVEAKGSGWVGVEGESEETPEGAPRVLAARTGLQLQDSAFRAVEKVPSLFAVVLSGEKPLIQPDLREYQAYSWIPAGEVDSLLKAAAERKAFQRALLTVSKGG